MTEPIKGNFLFYYSFYQNIDVFFDNSPELKMPVVEDQISQSSSDDGYYYRKSKPFVKNPSKIFVGGLPYSTSDG